MNKALFSSNRMDWQTPDNVLKLVREFHGYIGLDPATVESNPTGATKIYTPEDDGLKQSWRGFGPVFVNPPYGRGIKHWAAKMRQEYLFNDAFDMEMLALLPARTDTMWWHYDVLSATRILFWQGRLRFKGAPAPATFPSAIAYWGHMPVSFIRVFGSYGWIP